MPAKPDMEYAWAVTSALKTEPNDTKKQAGWVVEKPPVEWMNWLQNRMDTFLQHINERGLPEWDTNTSYLQGAQVYASDYETYTAVQANDGEDPTTDVTNTYWRKSGMGIKSIQRGTITIGAGSLTGTATLSPAVDMDKTELRNLGFETTATSQDDGPTKLVLTNTTTVTASRSANAGINVISWEITEFN